MKNLAMARPYNLQGFAITGLNEVPSGKGHSQTLVEVLENHSPPTARSITSGLHRIQVPPAPTAAQMLICFGFGGSGGEGSSCTFPSGPVSVNRGREGSGGPPLGGSPLSLSS